jgi:lipoprotein-releasing system permease protein
MSFETFVGGRYLRSKERRAFTSLITMLAIAGVTVGVMALIVVIAVMSGAESDFQHRILGVTAQAVIMRHGGDFSDVDQVQQRVQQVPGVAAVTPFIYSQVMIRSASGEAMAVLKGVDPATANHVLAHPGPGQLSHLTRADAAGVADGASGILLGRILAQTLKVAAGDRIFLVSPRGRRFSDALVPVMRQLRVAGISDSGMYEYDKSFAYMSLAAAQKLLVMPKTVTGLEVRVSDAMKAPEIARKIAETLGFPYWTRNWVETNRNLFSALRLQKTVMFVILILIVLVAAFNIASALIMMVMEKTQDVSILKAMGATDDSIRNIFVFKGMTIGALGTVLGGCFGFILCELLKHYDFIKLPEDVYYFTSLPVKLQAMDVGLIIGATLVICFLASLYPAQRAARLNPVDGIRFG